MWRGCLLYLGLGRVLRGRDARPVVVDGHHRPVGSERGISCRTSPMPSSMPINRGRHICSSSAQRRVAANQQGASRCRWPGGISRSSSILASGSRERATVASLVSTLRYRCVQSRTDTWPMIFSGSAGFLQECLTPRSKTVEGRRVASRSSCAVHRRCLRSRRPL